MRLSLSYGLMKREVRVETCLLDNIYMKKKGFTLIELLAVIVILAIIALIAVPSIMNVINHSIKESFLNSAYGLIKAGDLYYAKQELVGENLEETVFNFPNEIGELKISGNIPQKGTMKISSDGNIAISISNGKYCAIKGFEDKSITITEDIENCIIPVRITNLVLSNTRLQMEVSEEKTIGVNFEPIEATNKTLKWTSSDKTIATVENGVIKGKDDGLVTVFVETTDGSSIKKQIDLMIGWGYKNGILSSKNECIIENDCSVGTKLKVQVNDEESHQFYIIENTETDITMIMDRNLEGKVPWMNKTDYAGANVNGTECSFQACTDEGPITAINALRDATDDWENIDAKEVVYSDDKGAKQYIDIKITMRARMLTYMEATNLIDKNGGSCPNYLYTNLYSTYTDGKAMSYWLPAANNNYQAVVINYIGSVTNSTNYVSNQIGLRPVITLSK